MAYEIKRFPYSGTVDADGHVLEPGDLWENYLEDRYKARALAHQGRRRRLRVSRDRSTPVSAHRARFARNPRRDGRRRSAAAARPPLRRQHAVRFVERRRTPAAAEAGEPGMRAAVPDHRIAVGGGTRRSGTEPRLRARLQPMDRRLLSQIVRPPRADCATHVARSGRLCGRTRARGERRLQRRVGESVQPSPRHPRRRRNTTCCSRSAANSTCRSRFTRRSRRTRRRPAFSTGRTRAARGARRSGCAPSCNRR